MKNVDFFVVVIVLGVVFFLFYSVLPIFIGKYFEGNNYPIRNDFCKSDADCVVANMDYTGCSCDMKAINVDYSLYLSDKQAKISDLSAHCSVVCEEGFAEYLENMRVIVA